MGTTDSGSRYNAYCIHFSSKSNSGSIGSPRWLLVALSQSSTVSGLSILTSCSPGAVSALSRQQLEGSPAINHTLASNCRLWVYTLVLLLWFIVIIVKLKGFAVYFRGFIHYLCNNSQPSCSTHCSITRMTRCYIFWYAF